VAIEVVTDEKAVRELVPKCKRLGAMEIYFLPLTFDRDSLLILIYCESFSLFCGSTWETNKAN